MIINCVCFQGNNPNYKSISQHCNLWRNFDDIYDSWDSVLGIINYYGEDKDGFGQFAGPGHWNDPDMLIIGNKLTNSATATDYVIGHLLVK